MYFGALERLRNSRLHITTYSLLFLVFGVCLQSQLIG